MYKLLVTTWESGDTQVASAISMVVLEFASTIQAQAAWEKLESDSAREGFPFRRMVEKLY